MSSVPRSFPQLLSGGLHQRQTQVAQVGHLVLAQAAGQRVLVLQPLFPDAFDLFPSLRRQAGEHRAAVLRVGHALDQAVTLEVVDQAGDVPWCRVERHRKLAQGRVASAQEAEQQAEAARAQSVVLGPALLQELQGAGGQAQGRQGFDRRDVDLEWIKKLAETLQVQAAVLVDAEAALLEELLPDVIELHYRVFHSEGLHYYHIQLLVASYSPG